jgi:prepilin-type N-terminal cleavage/methylation domain-containing protein
MNKYFNNNGFSIIEIIAALAVIAIGFIGVMSLAVQNSRVEYTNKNTLIAAHLAQEGLELARNKRDDNFLNPGTEWFDGFAIADDYATSTIYFDETGSIAIDLDSLQDINNDEAKLYLNGEGFYVHGAGTDTIFRRIIVTKNDYAASSTAVSCLVEYGDRGQKNQYQADTVLWNWR